MKLSTLVIVGLLGAGAVGLWRKESESHDPVVKMRELFNQFPDGYSGVAYNVTKTESLVNPVVAYIDFDGTIEYEMTFHWTGKQWIFSKLFCRSNGNDFTGWGGGLELMMRPPMRAFLAKAGWEPTPEQEKEAEEMKARWSKYLEDHPVPSRDEVPQWDKYGKPINRGEPQAAAATLPRPVVTPNPEQIRAEIERKYGTRSQLSK